MGKFHIKSLLGKGVVPGKKIQSSAYEQLFTELGFNKLTINAKAAEMMNLRDEDYIFIMDLGKDSVDAGFRYVLCQGFQANGRTIGSKLAANSNADGEGRLSFSYSPVYGAMLKDDVNVSEISALDLIQEGIMQEYTTIGEKKSKRALKRAYFKVEPLLDENGEHTPIEVFETSDGETIEQLCYILTDVKFEKVAPYVPKAEGEVTDVNDSDDNIDDLDYNINNSEE